MAHEDLKQKAGAKGNRQAPVAPVDYAKLYNDATAVSPDKKLSLQEILENAAVINALGDILVDEGLIKGKDGKGAHDRIFASQDLYGGLLAGLIMIIMEDGLVSDMEMKLECGILASHRAMIHFGTRMVTLEKILEFRQEAYKAEVAKRRKVNYHPLKDGACRSNFR